MTALVARVVAGRGSRAANDARARPRRSPRRAAARRTRWHWAPARATLARSSRRRAGRFCAALGTRRGRLAFVGAQPHALPLRLAARRAARVVDLPPRRAACAARRRRRPAARAAPAAPAPSPARAGGRRPRRRRVRAVRARVRRRPVRGERLVRAHEPHGRRDRALRAARRARLGGNASRNSTAGRQLELVSARRRSSRERRRAAQLRRALPRRRELRRRARRAARAPARAARAAGADVRRRASAPRGGRPRLTRMLLARSTTAAHPRCADDDVSGSRPRSRAGAQRRATPRPSSSPRRLAGAR